MTHIPLHHPTAAATHAARKPAPAMPHTAKASAHAAGSACGSIYATTRR